MKLHVGLKCYENFTKVFIISCAKIEYNIQYYVQTLSQHHMHTQLCKIGDERIRNSEWFEMLTVPHYFLFETNRYFRNFGCGWISVSSSFFLLALAGRHWHFIGIWLIFDFRKLLVHVAAVLNLYWSTIIVAWINCTCVFVCVDDHKNSHKNLIYSKIMNRGLK